jgi:hypothetical protein
LLSPRLLEKAGICRLLRQSAALELVLGVGAIGLVSLIGTWAPV